MTDVDYLNYLTIKKFNTTEDAKLYYAAPVILKSNSEWAITSPHLSPKNGELLGRGLNSYLYRKINGVWTYIGLSGDTADSWDDAVKALSSQIPEDIIPDCALAQQFQC